MFSLRPSTKQDTAAVDAMMARAFPQLMQGDYPAEVLALAIPIIARAQPNLLGSGTYYVAERAGRILGAGGWTRQSPGTGQITDGLAHIRHVATDPEAARRGIARAILDHVFTQTRAAGMQRLDCVSTLTAVPFYAALGFVSVRNLKVTLAPEINFPAVEMTRAL